MKKILGMRWISLLAAASLVACGGGSSNSSSSSNSNSSGGSTSLTSTSPQDLVVTGVAATGAPLANATLQIYGKDGLAILATPATITSDGSYTATIPASAVGPFVFEVDDGNEKIYSLLPDRTGSVVNVTPLSNLIAAKLSSTGNPSTLVSELAASTATISASTTSAASSAIMTALQPLITALGLSSDINPLTTPFTANGTGFDRMLDSLDVKIEPKGTTSQIEITMKQSVDEDQDLPKIAFASDQTPTALPVVDATKLVTAGLTPKIQTLLDKLTACYAEPLSSRISTGGTSASAIQSQICKDVFLGSNPAAYKSSGMVISKTQHFGGMFTASSTAGVKFSDPKFFYKVGASRTNGPTIGDVVFGYRWKDEFGNFQIEKNVARLDSDGALKLIGNQYIYDGGIGATSQRRNFLKQPESTFHSTGYNFGLSCTQLNQNQSAGNKIVKVNVTSPGGRKITLIPNLTGTTCDYSYFVIATPKNSSGTVTLDAMGDPSNATGTGFIRLQTQFETGTTTAANHPRSRNTGLAYFGGPDGTDLTNAQIEAMPQFGTWTFEYYKSTAASSPVVATQYYKTTARALTIDGFKKSVKLHQLTTDLKTKLTTESTCSTSTPTYCWYKQVTGPFVASWSKSTDPGMSPALFKARIYGLKDITVGTPDGYDDQIKFLSSRTTASILCGQDQSAQSYCSGSNFGTNASIDGLDLIGRAPDGTDVSHFHTLRKLP